jgi:predicted NAD/FAD-dependent oxidoreductase
MRCAAPPAQAPACAPAHSSAPAPRRRSALHAAPPGRPAAEQVTFSTPLPRDGLSVGIIGGGLSGARRHLHPRLAVTLTAPFAPGACTAAALSEHGISSVVYDTGEHGPGGRLATRALGRDKRLVFDHAAQFLTPPRDERFAEDVARWRAAGVLSEWSGAVGTLRPGGAFAALASPGGARLVAPRGMRSLAEHILGVDAPLATLRRPCWVGEMRANTDDGIWRLSASGRAIGDHHFLVIAHNGKCATRLLRPSGAPLVDAQMARMKLSAIWCLCVAFAEPLNAPCEGAYVTGLPALAWAGNNSAKMGLGGGGNECWTLLSTAAYGKANKCPQEAIPADVAARVTAEMLTAFASALGVRALPATTLTRAQLWGAALPTNTPNVPVIFDAAARVAMCGDWLLGASAEAAAISGRAAGDAIAAAVAASHAGAGSLEHLSAGLTARFVPIGASEIGTAEKGVPAAAAGAPPQRRSSSSGGGSSGAGASGRSYSSRGERRRGGAAEQVRETGR